MSRVEVKIFFFQIFFFFLEKVIIDAIINVIKTKKKNLNQSRPLVNTWIK